MENDFVFFGTPEYAAVALTILIKKGFIPKLVVCSPDAPIGRKQILTAPPVKILAEEHNIPVFQPNKINAEAIDYIKSINPKYAIVAAYNKILPQNLLDIIPNKFLNIHPSLLPKYRGPAPDIGPILNQDIKTGVSIIILDNLVDHGPILAQEEIVLTGQEYSRIIGKELFKQGAEILCNLIPKWLNNQVSKTIQNHDEATFTKKLTKSDGEIKINDDPNILWAKWRAYYPWPGLYFFDKDGKRIKITQCKIENNKFIIEKVIPEGGKEISYDLYK